MDAKTKLVRIVENARGDDLERAERQFAGMSDEDLDKPWGHNGITCREVLEGHRKERREWEAALALAKSVAG